MCGRRRENIIQYLDVLCCQLDFLSIKLLFCLKRYLLLRHALRSSFLLKTFSTAVDQNNNKTGLWLVLSPKFTGSILTEHVSNRPITTKHQQSRRINVICCNVVIEQEQQRSYGVLSINSKTSSAHFMCSRHAFCNSWPVELEAGLGTGTYKSLSYALSKSSSSSIPGPNSPKTGCQAPMSAEYSKQLPKRLMGFFPFFQKT